MYQYSSQPYTEATAANVLIADALEPTNQRTNTRVSDHIDGRQSDNEWERGSRGENTLRQSLDFQAFEKGEGERR